MRLERRLFNRFDRWRQCRPSDRDLLSFSPRRHTVSAGRTADRRPIGPPAGTKGFNPLPHVPGTTDNSVHADMMP
jgi:hypothetical protein